MTGSFGTLDEVSKTVLPEGEGISSKLVDAYTVNKSYVYDYIVTQEGRPRKHIKVGNEVLNGCCPVIPSFQSSAILCKLL